MNDTHTEKLILKALPRTVMGKSVRVLRKNNTIPANIYGTGFESKAISVDLKEFNTIYKQAGETGVIYVEVEKDSIPTLVTDIQFDPIKNNFLHVDLRKVDLKKKIEAHVPFKFIGESEAVKTKNGVLITQMDEVLVEALPTDIPHEIEVDISVLGEIGDEIKLSDIPITGKYEYKEDFEKVIVSVTEHKEEVIEVQTTTEAPEILTERPEGEEGEGAEAGGGEAPAAEAQPAKEEKK